MKVTPATIATRSHQSATRLFARELRTWRRRISYFAFTAQAATRRGEWNDLAAVLDWLGNAELSCRPIDPYGLRRRGEPHNLSLFALLTLFDIACHAARNLQHLSDYNKNSFVSGVLSLYPLARGCRRIWRGVVLVYWFRRRDAA